MKISLITLFPEMLDAVHDFGVSSRAVDKGLLELKCVNPRDFTEDRHRTVDARPYGGGPGMVMMAEPLGKAIAAAKTAVSDGEEGNATVVYMSPQGKPLTQAWLEDKAEQGKPLVLLAGRYEGVDERLLEREIDEEVSLGDYVLSGGELAAMVVIDGICRLLPGVLGHELSAVEDSFTEGLLDCPHYTRPESYEGDRVPSVLLSGDHARIARWRAEQALYRTWRRRPDLIDSLKAEGKLSEQQLDWLASFERQTTSDNRR